MTPAPRRRRAVILLALALGCGGIAASEVAGRTRSLEARAGPALPVLVAAHNLEPGRELTRGDLAVRAVPRRFAPPDALAEPGEVEGATVAGAIARGSYVTVGSLGGAGGGERPGALRRGQRAVELGVAGGAALSGTAGPGARVDILVTTDPRQGAGRTFVALEDVELLALEAGAGDHAGAEDGSASTATARATLRVTARQAVYLTAAASFAREVRLLPRPLGDRGRVGRAAITAAGL
jgi:pilus assembly protein CpaB